MDSIVVDEDDGILKIQRSKPGRTEPDTPAFLSEDAVWTAIRKKFPGADPGNAKPMRDKDIPASHPLPPHQGVDDKNNNDDYLGTIFKQLAVNLKNEVVEVWTTNINLKKE
jgi:hypothetical protein